MSHHLKKRRKNYFIKKDFQARFFIKFALLLLLESVVIAALFMHISKGTLITAYRGTELTIQKTGAYFLVSFLLISLAVGAAVGIAAIFIFMLLSHRIGGPLYRFEQSIADVQKGDLSHRVRLRKTDQLAAIRERMNFLLEDMDRRIAHIKKDAHKGLSLIDKGASSDTVDSLKKILKEIVSSLEYFKTSK